MPEQYVLKDELAKEVVKSMKPNLGGRRVMGNKDGLDIELKENKILSDLKENSLKQNNHLQKISNSMSAMVGFERDKQRRTKDQQTELTRELKKSLAVGSGVYGGVGKSKTTGGDGGILGTIGNFLTGGATAAGGIGLLSRLRGSKLGGGTERFFGVGAKGGSSPMTVPGMKKAGLGGTLKNLGKGGLKNLAKMGTGKAGILSALFAIPSLALDYSSMKKSQAMGDMEGEDLTKESMAGTVGGTGGALAGAAAGAAIGSVVPVIGTAIGGIIGGLLGGLGGSKLGEGLYETRAEKKAKEADKKKKESELVKKMNANIKPKDMSKEIKNVPEMKEAKKGIDMTKKESSVLKTGTTAMSKVDYTDDATKMFDERVSKKISAIESSRDIEADSAKEAEQYLKAGEQLGTRYNDDMGAGVKQFTAVKKVTAEGDEDVKKFYSETYNDFRNAIDNYIKRSLKNGDLDPKTGQWSDPLAQGAYTRFYDSLYNPMINKIDNMKDVNNTKKSLYKGALQKAADEAHNESMKSNLGKGGDKKSIFGKISDFFKGIQGVEAGTAGDMAGEAAMATDEPTSQGKDKGKDKSKTSFFSKFLSGMAKLSPVTAAAAYAAETVRGKTPGKGDFEFGETPDMPGESTPMTKVYNRKPKTRADIVKDDTMKMVLNPEDGRYYPPDSPILNKFKPNQLRSVKDILDSGQSTQQASTMAVANNNVNNVSNNSNQNIYTGKLNVDVDNYAERVNDF
jgi:uncharacterized protein (DUF697 family)